MFALFDIVAAADTAGSAEVFFVALAALHEVELGICQIRNR